MTEAIAALSRSRISELTLRFMAGEIGLTTWQLEMVREIRVAHVAASAVANRGWQQLTADSLTAVKPLVKSQLGFLRGFARAVSEGTQRLGNSLLRRARLYAGAVRKGVSVIRTDLQARSGYTEAMRVLGRADHCNGNADGCVEQAALGWQPIDQVRPIGDSLCGNNCHCRIVYRSAGGTVSE
jgi:hypothetical protein